MCISPRPLERHAGLQLQQLAFARRPPPKPTSLPPAPTTRWHGTITGTGLWLQAVPTARAAPGITQGVGDLRRRSRISPYGIAAISRPDRPLELRPAAHLDRHGEVRSASPAK